jgi:hypothetical protein
LGERSVLAKPEGKLVVAVALASGVCSASPRASSSSRSLLRAAVSARQTGGQTRRRVCLGELGVFANPEGKLVVAVTTGGQAHRFGRLGERVVPAKPAGKLVVAVAVASGLFSPSRPPCQAASSRQIGGQARRCGCLL